MSDLQEWLQERVSAVVDEAEVPGLVAGVVHGGDRAVVASGVTSLDTGVEVTRDTVFQIGSNTKLYTATAAMRLVEQVQLTLEQPVCDVVPFRLATPGAAEQVTMWHLLTHTSGIDGDITGPDGLGWADDMVARWVDALADVPLLHPVGSTWSYCNAGWVLLGRVIEVVTGQTYEQALRALVLDPLGARRTLIRPEEVLLHRAAVGHLPLGADGANVVAPVWGHYPACAPAGSVMVSSIDEVLDFVEMHLNDGERAGSRLLHPETARSMRATQVAMPRTRGQKSMGLGWMIGAARDGRTVITHGGGTLGQLSTLHALPDQDLAVVVLTNSVSGGYAGMKLAEEAMRSLAGADISDPPPEAVGGAPAVDLAGYAGRYARRGTTVIVRTVDDTLELEIAEDPPHPLVQLPVRRLVVRPVDAEVFVDEASGLAVRFDEFDSAGRPATLFNFRVLRRSDVPS